MVGRYCLFSPSRFMLDALLVELRCTSETEKEAIGCGLLFY